MFQSRTLRVSCCPQLKPFFKAGSLSVQSCLITFSTENEDGAYAPFCLGAAQGEIVGRHAVDNVRDVLDKKVAQQICAEHSAVLSTVKNFYLLAYNLVQVRYIGGISYSFPPSINHFYYMKSSNYER
jgi:hypothetical protein